MARKQGRKQGKGRNGEGQSVSLFFDTRDPMESKALAMSQVLASKHGRRKQVLIAALAALYDAYMDTGELPTATTVANALSGVSPQAGRSFAPVTSRTPAPASSTPRRPREYDDDQPTVVISSGRKASAQQIANNFLSDVGGLFN